MMFGKSSNDLICPLIGKACIKEKCAWWCTVQGYDINTGKQLDSKDCILTTLPLLLIENSAQQRSTGAAVESMRNEVVNRANTTNALLSNYVLPSRVSQVPPQEILELPQSSD